MSAAKLGALVVMMIGCAEAAGPVPSSLFISDYRANAIVRYDGVTGELVDTFASLDRPASVRLGPDDHVYAAGFGRGQVTRHDAVSGAMMDVFYWDTALLEEPVELQFHGDELVVLGNDTNNIVVVGPDGKAMRTFGYGVIRTAHDFVIDSDHRVLVATEPAVQIWDLTTGTQLGEVGRGNLALATSIALGDGVIYVADWELDRVVRFSTSGTYLGPLIEGLHDPICIDVGFDGALYVMDATGVHRYDAETGDHLARLVAKDDRLLYPRSFTFVRD